MCWSSRSQENISAEFFNDLVRQRPTILLKRDSTIGGICKILKNTFFIEQSWPTASGYIRILTTKNLQYQLIISKSYKHAGRRGRSKLLLPTHINYQRCTLVKGLFKSFSFSKIALKAPLLCNIIFF